MPAGGWPWRKIILARIDNGFVQASAAFILERVMWPAISQAFVLHENDLVPAHFHIVKTAVLFKFDSC